VCVVCRRIAASAVQTPPRTQVLAGSSEDRARWASQHQRDPDSEHSEQEGDSTVSGVGGFYPASAQFSSPVLPVNEAQVEQLVGMGIERDVAIRCVVRRDVLECFALLQHLCACAFAFANACAVVCCVVPCCVVLCCVVLCCVVLCCVVLCSLCVCVFACLLVACRALRKARWNVEVAIELVFE
jgi:hypothetical protein